MDPGLTPNELQTIRRALSKETNPNHLIGLAASLSPFYPVSASLLYAKSQLLELRTRANQERLALDGRGAIEHLRGLVEKTANGHSRGEETVRWVVRPLTARPVLEQTTASWPEVQASWADVCPVSLPWPKLERMKAAVEGIRDLPGEAGVALVRAVPPGAPQRFARNLQMLGFHEIYPRTRGSGPRMRAEDLLQAVREGQSRRCSVGDALLLRRRRELDAFVLRQRASLEAALNEVRRAASDLVVDPGADLSNVPFEIAHLARCLVEEIGPGIWIVMPREAQLALQGSGGRESAEKTERTRDRSRWIEWYERSSKL